MLSNYTIEATIAERTKTLILRGIRNSDGQPVIIKRLKAENPDLKDIKRLKNEYEISSNIACPQIIKSYSLETDGNSFALILEDFGGESLSEYLSKNQLSLHQFFAIAITLADILSQLHSIPIIHKDIKPSNIIINPETQEIKLTDFNIAIRSAFEYPAFQNPHGITGTLSYMSPEQTGRMNRYLDHRTDLYSLGVTFYEMLTGQLPFTSNDPLELIHAHLAVSPVPPHHCCSSIPLGVSELVLRLLAKRSEEGYQSAQGLKFDLEHCLQEYQQKNTIEPFILGQRDRSSQLLLSQKLYGRESQIQTLLNTFTQIQQGNNAIVFVSGYAGSGKTSMIKQLNQPILKARGFYLSGKFDQFKKDTPYSAIIDAFQNLIRQLLTTPQEELKTWQSQLRTALRNDGNILINLIPELELLMGKQPSVSSLEEKEFKNRFHRVFQKFVSVFCQPEHPLVLFLDDLQWADFASIQLIQSLLMNHSIKYFLLIGAYRDNEVKLTNPLLHFLDQIKNQLTNVVEIQATPLNLNQVQALITDTLQAKADLEAIQRLSDLVFEKTQGNPFFINQFLRTLDEEKLLTYNHQIDRWEWDLEAIQGVGLSDLNLIELLLRNLRKLPETTQERVKLAACIGDEFSLSTLATISEDSSAVIWEQLQPALKKGLILPKTGEDSVNNEDLIYKFLHDRIQQAAYSLIPVSEQKLTHFRIGQLLLNTLNTNTNEKETQLFTIVNQLNFGLDWVTDENEKIYLAQLNLQAAKKAKANVAYDLAVDFLDRSRQLLTEKHWETAYNLILEVYLESAEVAYLNTDLANAESFCELGIQFSLTNEDKARFLRIEINIKLAQNQINAVLEKGLEALTILGVSLVEVPPENLSISTIKNLPLMTDSSMLLAMEILNVVMGPACFSGSGMALSIIYTMLDLSQTYGNSLPSLYGYMSYATTLVCINQNIQFAFQLGDFTLKLLGNLNGKSVAPRVNISFYLNIFHKQKHLKETLNHLKESIQESLEVGNIEFACHHSHYYCLHLFFTGENLETVHNKQKHYLDFIENQEQEHQLLLLKTVTQTVDNLRQDWDHKTSLQGDFLNQTAVIDYLLEINNQIVLFNIYHFQGFLYYLFYDYSSAIENFKTALTYYQFVAGEFVFTEHNLFYSLSLLGENNQENLEQVAENQKLMQIWSDHAPMNFQFRYHLVEAEKARVLGESLTAMELYDRAIAGAKENGYMQHVALGNELAGKFYLSLGREIIAQTYFAEAHYAYRRWEAIAKVKHLESTYPQFRLAETMPLPKIKTVHNLDSSTSSDPQNLDLMTIIKASQTLADEIILDRLLGKLIQIVVENVGAQIGYLILEEDSKLYIKAQAQNTAISLTESLPVTPDTNLPLSIINYVVRTQENVILDEAIKDNLFHQDAYIVKNQCQSILCTPILNQGELLGLIYLENNLTTEAFTSNRLEVIKILSAQAAISLKNAVMYEKMKALNTNLTEAKEALAESNRNLEQKVKERTQNLSETLEILQATQAELRFENNLLRSEQDFSDYNYQVGGSLPMDAPTYVVRSADRYLYKEIKQRNFCYILNPRQMGKSSLMVRMMYHLRNEGFCCATVDLSRLGSDEVTREQWYKGLAVELWKNFNLLKQVNLKRWWNEQMDLSPVQRFSQFLEDILLAYVGRDSEIDEQPIVIFIDEIDSVLSLNFKVNDFFSLIRSCYNNRGFNPDYQRLTFVLLGVATPSDLMSDYQRTPFNIGREIILKGFKKHEAQPLIEGLGNKVNHPQVVLREVLNWTNGQPFLTQKICYLIREGSEIIYDQEREKVTELVQQNILQDWETKDNPEHLKTLRDRVLNSVLPRNQILGLYQNILEQKTVKSQDTPEEKELLLSGLVEKEDGNLQVRNRIYETIFNRDWVKKHQNLQGVL